MGSAIKQIQNSCNLKQGRKVGRSYTKESRVSNGDSISTAARSQASTPPVSRMPQRRGERASSPELTFFLLPPLKLQHHIIVSHKSVDRCVQVKDIPEKKTVLSPELGDHHCHQPIAERLERETPFQLAVGNYAPRLLLSLSNFSLFPPTRIPGF